MPLLSRNNPNLTQSREEILNDSMELISEDEQTDHNQVENENNNQEEVQEIHEPNVEDFLVDIEGEELDDIEVVFNQIK